MIENILILDDRKTFLERLVEAIRLSGPSVDISAHRTVDAAWKAFNSRNHWDRIVIDLMVPPGELLAHVDTSSGLDTGQVFIEMILGQSDVTYDCIVVHSARNRGLRDSISSSKKVVELPKTEMSRVNLAKWLLREDAIYG